MTLSHRQLLGSLERSSPELSLQPPSKPAQALDEASAALEDVAAQQLQAQEVWEEQTLLRLEADAPTAPRASFDDSSSCGSAAVSPFYMCRYMLSQLGFFAWERR